jgi:hypothetical protein
VNVLSTVTNVCGNLSRLAAQRQHIPCTVTPICTQEDISAQEFDVGAVQTHAELAESLVCSLTRPSSKTRGKALALSNFFVDNVNCNVPKFNTKAKTCSSYMHSDQLGFEEILLQADFEAYDDGRGGVFASLDYITNSWQTGMIPTCYDVDFPVILIHEATAEISLALNSIAGGRVIIGWPMVLDDQHRFVPVHPVSAKSLRKIIVTRMEEGGILAMRVDRTHIDDHGGSVSLAYAVPPGTKAVPPLLCCAWVAW